MLVLKIVCMVLVVFASGGSSGNSEIPTRISNNNNNNNNNNNQAGDQGVDLGTIFDPSDSNAGYQRRYTIEVHPKQEDCFFLPNVRENQVLNYHFMVRTLGTIMANNHC